MEISKELLSEVLGEDVRLGVYTTVESDEDELVQHIMKIEIYGNRVSYWRYYEECGDDRTMCKSNINIYELAFKLKIWAYSNCCELVSYTEGCEIFQTQLGETIKYFYAETEVEAIILASEWILKELNEKQLQH